MTLIEFPTDYNPDGFWEDEPNLLGVDKAVACGIGYYDEMVSIAGILSMIGG